MADPSPVPGASGGLVALLVTACGLGIVGAISLSQATAGVGTIALGCLFAILARIAQAGVQHKTTIRALADAAKR